LTSSPEIVAHPAETLAKTTPGSIASGPAQAPSQAAVTGGWGGQPDTDGVRQAVPRARQGEGPDRFSDRGPAPLSVARKGSDMPHDPVPLSHVPLTHGSCRQSRRGAADQACARSVSSRERNPVFCPRHPLPSAKGRGMIPTATKTTDAVVAGRLAVQRRVRSGKTLVGASQSFSSSFSDAWMPVLRNISLGLPGTKVFSSRVFGTGTARHERGTRAGMGRRIAAHLCPSMGRKNSSKRKCDPPAHSSYVFCRIANLSYSEPVLRALPSTACTGSPAARLAQRSAQILRAGSPKRLPGGSGSPGHDERSLATLGMTVASLGMTVSESLTPSCRP
jgi:hypothetical protein